MVNTSRGGALGRGAANGRGGRNSVNRGGRATEKKREISTNVAMNVNITQNNSEQSTKHLVESELTRSVDDRIGVEKANATMKEDSSINSNVDTISQTAEDQERPASNTGLKKKQWRKPRP